MSYYAPRSLYYKGEEPFAAVCVNDKVRDMVLLAANYSTNIDTCLAFLHELAADFYIYNKMFVHSYEVSELGGHIRLAATDMCGGVYSRTILIGY